MKNRIAILALLGAASISVPTLESAKPTAALQQGPTSSSTEPSRSVWDGVYTEEQATRGAALYAQRCARCHGQDLTGGEIAPALNSGEFKSNWSGLSVDDLFERIKVSMPQDNPGILSRQQTADTVAFVLSKNGFPAGKTELPREAEVVKQIRFEQNKPETAASGEKPGSFETATASAVTADQGADPADPLAAFLKQHLKDSDGSVDKTTRYSSVSVDLRDDGAKEFIVYVIGHSWCGSGGCRMLIVSPEGNSYKVITETTITRLPIRVLAKKSQGWHDLGVWIQGGGVQPGYEADLPFSGVSYPHNPSIPPARHARGPLEGKVILPKAAEGTPLY